MITDLYARVGLCPPHHEQVKILSYFIISLWSFIAIFNIFIFDKL